MLTNRVKNYAYYTLDFINKKLYQVFEGLMLSLSTSFNMKSFKKI